MALFTDRRTVIRRAGPAFWKRLAREIEGDVLSDLFSRGRYSTDASLYQCFPAGVVCPKTASDVSVAIEMAREEGLPVIARGGGTSTAGQALGEGLIVDFSKYLRNVGEIDNDRLRCIVEPGCTTASLNAVLGRKGLFFPVEIASAEQATIGGMLGNNSSGVRALRYGSMRDNVASAEALLSDGQRVCFNPISETDKTSSVPGRDRLLDLLQFGELHEKAIATYWRLRAPGMPEPEAYDLRTLLASPEDQNMARLLAGSEGTLAIATRIELKLAELPQHSAIGACRFSSLGAALSLVPKIMLLNPCAIELLDSVLLKFAGLDASRDPLAARLTHGGPCALLIVEFDHENAVENARLLKALEGYAADAKAGFSILEFIGDNARAALWQLRRKALMHSWSAEWGMGPQPLMDGAVPLRSLEAYGRDLEELLEKLGLRSAIYGQAGRGALQVRPVLDLRFEQDRKRLRLFSDAMVDLLRVHGGTLTGGYGLGLANSSALERMLDREALGLFSQIKAQLDPGNVFNPGKILRAPSFDDPSFLRAPLEKDGQRAHSLPFGGSSGRFSRCNGLSLCRTEEAALACPSYLLTRDERDSPRGRANSMRLAISGQLGEHSAGSPDMLDTMRLCLSCKACKSCCPSAIDIPRMKVESLAAARARGWEPPAISLFARLPEYTDRARRWRAFIAMRDLFPGLSRLSERKLGLAADRPWPRWSGRRFRPPLKADGPFGPVALFADTFNRSFEPANLRAASTILTAAGYGVVAFRDTEGGEPLCCGRTYYDAGHIDDAKRHAVRLSKALANYEAKGITVIGLEPACVLMMRDEYAALGLVAANNPRILLFEEFALRQHAQKTFALTLKPIEAELIVHAHCHERACGLEDGARQILKLIPGLSVTAAPPGCCGLNGFTGMTADTFEASLGMAELSLFPAIRRAGGDAFVAATGFSCRKQILDGLGRAARHPAMILELALKGDVEILA